MVIISCYQAKDMLDAYLVGRRKFRVSLNLGLSLSEIGLEGDEFVLPDDSRIPLSDIKKVRDDPKVCYALQNGKMVKVQFFSDDTHRFYKLMPTGSGTPPTLEISGIRMHVTKAMDPWKDTEEKVKVISPVSGSVLDTCTGLGYTAIMCIAQGADRVVTCEIDPNCSRVAEFNPWSDELFSNDRIEQVSGDVFEKIKKMPSGSFDRVVHDPPRFSLAGLLYSLKFYGELFRVMRAGGRLYHYTGSPGSRKRGINLVGNVCARLKKAGFSHVRPAHYGAAADKDSNS